MDKIQLWIRDRCRILAEELSQLTALQCCTTRQLGTEWIFLFEDASLTYAQPSAIYNALESFLTDWWPVDRFLRLFWKTLSGQWKKTRGNGLIQSASHIHHVTDGIWRYILEKTIARQKPTIPFALFMLLICSRLLSEPGSYLFMINQDY